MSKIINTYFPPTPVIVNNSNDVIHELVTETFDDPKQDSDGGNDVARRLKIASLICATFIAVEVIGGIVAGSLTVLSDAAHLLADLAGFGVALAASHLASLPATEKHTYGLKRVEALAALFSVSSLALVTVVLAVEAARRIYLFILDPSNVETVDGKVMSAIAAVGVAVNVALAIVLGEGGDVHLPGMEHSHDHDHVHDNHNHHGAHHHEDHASDHHHEEAGLLAKVNASYSTYNSHDHGHNHDHSEDDHHSRSDAIHIPLPEKSVESPPLLRNINLHAAYLHVIGDLLLSLGVLVAGVVIWFQPTWHLIDPICTIFFAGLVFHSTIEVFRSSLSVLLEEVPPHIELGLLEAEIKKVVGVSNTHCLHVWSVSHGCFALSVHVTAVDPQQALKDIDQICRKFKIHHATIQTTLAIRGQECATCETRSGDEHGGCFNLV
jgi:zinc transporter 2